MTADEHANVIGLATQRVLASERLHAVNLDNLLHAVKDCIAELAHLSQVKAAKDQRIVELEAELLKKG